MIPLESFPDTLSLFYQIRRSVWYKLDVQMVATDIRVSRRVGGGEAVPVEGGSVNLADTVLVEMTPAVLGDAGQIVPLDGRL